MDFTLDLPSIDYDLVADWLSEPGPELSLTFEGVQQLYSEPASPASEAPKKQQHSSLPLPPPPPYIPSSSPTSVPRSIAPSFALSSPSISPSPSLSSLSSLHAPTPTPRQQTRPVSVAISEHESLWDDDSDDDDSESMYSQPSHGVRIRLSQLGDEEEDDSSSDSTTLHNVPTSLSPSPIPPNSASTSNSTSTSTPTPNLIPFPSLIHSFRYPTELLRSCSYACSDLPFLTLLDSLDEVLLRTPLTVFADVLYTSCVRPDPLSGAHGISHSSDLDRVSERTEEPEEDDDIYYEESEESEDGDSGYGAEEISPSRTCVTPTQWSPWPEKHIRDPVQVVTSITLPPTLLSSPEEEYHHHPKSYGLSNADSNSAPTPMTYLFLKPSRPQRDSGHGIGGFPTRVEPETPRRSRKASMKHILMRGLNLGWRDQVQIES